MRKRYTDEQIVTKLRAADVELGKGRTVAEVCRQLEVSCDRKPALGPNHVWTYDFIDDRLGNGGKIRILSVVDEYTRECQALEVRRH